MGPVAGPLTGAIERAYGWCPAEIIRIRAGTATANHLVIDGNGRRWFAKVYRETGDLSAEAAAVALADFARDGGVPVPAHHPDRHGEVFGRAGGLALSLWDFVDAETAEGGLRGRRWSEVGATVGRLHHRLAGHPSASPARRPAAGLRDPHRTAHRFDALIRAYRVRSRTAPGLTGYEAWALEAAVHRRALLPRVQEILDGLPALTTQVLHGDLASPNLLLRDDQVAAVIDFMPPTSGFVAWEIARIGCDPRTVTANPQWRAGLDLLLDSYREQYATPASDLDAVVALGCANTLSSTYPLAVPIKDPAAMTPDLEAYGRARHASGLLMLDALGG